MDQNQLDASLAKLESAWAQHQVLREKEVATRHKLEDASRKWEKALIAKDGADHAYKAWKSCLHEWTAAKERLAHSCARMDEYIAGFRD